MTIALCLCSFMDFLPMRGNSELGLPKLLHSIPKAQLLIMSLYKPRSVKLLKSLMSTFFIRVLSSSTTPGRCIKIFLGEYVTALGSNLMGTSVLEQVEKRKFLIKLAKPKWDCILPKRSPIQLRGPSPKGTMRMPNLRDKLGKPSIKAMIRALWRGCSIIFRPNRGKSELGFLKLFTSIPKATLLITSVVKRPNISRTSTIGSSFTFSFKTCINFSATFRTVGYMYFILPEVKSSRVPFLWII
ncbi:hypothetical protein FF38_08732 [Lucilia cuprina]|uniref:Uncharacterized protein n=1 Tax=Lucilia cuprina TaxID=7375 RepID=A0A0L0CN20_LUCCU|nr:hypothetical protein FF38_08732 [Lucilia cuprina]